jgi:hypothetical protein
LRHQPFSSLVELSSYYCVEEFDSIATQEFRALGAREGCAHPSRTPPNSLPSYAINVGGSTCVPYHLRAYIDFLDHGHSPIPGDRLPAL